MALPNVALVGCGYWGKNIARNFAQLGALRALIDPDRATAERLASQYGAEVRTFDEVLADLTIDAIAIAAPAKDHAALGLRALSAGKHVLIEKPIALSLEDGEALKAAAEAAKKTLMVGHLLQYNPAYKALKALVKEGRLGRVLYAYSNRVGLGKVRTEEDALFSFAPHDISMLLGLMGDQVPDQILKSSGSYLSENIDDEVRLDMRYADGRHAHVFVSWLHPIKEQKLVVVGSEGMAIFEDYSPDKSHHKLKLYPLSIDRSGDVPNPVLSEPTLVPYGSEEPLAEECRHFLACVEKGLSPLTDADEALRVLYVLTKAKFVS